MSTKSILFIFTSAEKVLNGMPTGWYLPEAAHPYYALESSFKIDSASPKGGAAPIDHNSVEMFKDDESVKFLSDPKAQELVKNTKKISEVKADDYDAIFVVGGHGPMIDLAQDKDLAKLLEAFYASKKIVSAVCHGPAAFNLANKPNSSESILSGIQATGFSNSEEAQTPYNDFVNILPFSLEDRIAERGGSYVKGDDWGVKVVYDGGVLTGQNPASAGALGQKLKELLA
ncbi:hypothetical protein CI109_107002 [Kwoniella shandongensis]|uniref:D-lactate dehydratase n=1 Tax=Kwoniella shandongensis TaxID=1734106 RepID=A0A5M6C601_9TREE|nr:uncharacterized protein CI109_000745 [Kwoniella shandongensis]KAA5530567.1 hypothetical protein CI109_000745 [Kwoniella shandongensis]